MSTLFTIIDKFRSDQQLVSLERELLTTKNEKRINKINKIISELNPEQENYDAKKTLNDIYDTYDKNKFKQPWKKLTKDQKIQKIKEYDSDLDSEDIINVIENKKVKYNYTDELIENIS